MQIEEVLLDFLVKLRILYIEIKAGFNCDDEIEQIDIMKLDTVLEDNGIDILELIENCIDLSFLPKLKCVDSEDIATELYEIFGLELTQEQANRLFNKYVRHKV